MTLTENHLPLDIRALVFPLRPTPIVLTCPVQLDGLYATWIVM